MAPPKFASHSLRVVHTKGPQAEDINMAVMMMPTAGKPASPGSEPPWQGRTGSAVCPLSRMPELGGKALSLVSSLLATKSPDRAPSKTCKEAGGWAASFCFLHVGGLKKDSCVPTFHAGT